MCISKMSRTFCLLSKKRVLANFFALSILLSPCGALAAPGELDDDQTRPCKDAIEVLYKAALNAYNNGRFSASKQMAVACQTLIEDSGSNRSWLPYAQSLSAKCDFELGKYDEAETEMSADLSELKNFGAPPEILRFYACDLAAILIHNMKGREALDLDVMYFCNIVRDLSARDIATIRRLYKVDGHDKYVVATHRLRK